MSFTRVTVKPDTLDDENRKFDQRPLDQPLFLNSVPKSGSHLLRNILRMFVPVESQYKAEFIQHQILQHHLAAFDQNRKLLSWGHLLFTDTTVRALAGVRQVLLVRDPYDWVIARARFFMSDEFKGPLEFPQDGSVGAEALLNMMILGIHGKEPPLAATFTYNALAWLGTGVRLIRYEDLVAALGDLDGKAAELFFTKLFEACGIERPQDWQARVRIGSDRNQSGTARENLTGVKLDLPAELPEMQRRLLDFAAPGLRGMLGYE
ncbi:MAG: hypothetical protein H0W65_00520 [Sphingomonas sp.]|uniref:hypothetical protein n=1 Tax=Sphingomonas sp. TaxID=28214 RepID=UPI0017B291AE|nr:hypothetical protein [Sphingomonas sp.]MBA3666194.1 hypothetical protein [Sphingomonas sp.]